MNKKLSFIIKLSLGILLIAILIKTVGFEEIYSTFKEVNILYIPLIIIIYIMGFITNTLNLRILLKPIKDIKYLTMFRYHVLSWSLSFFAPGKIGELSLLYFLKKDDVPLGKSSAVYFIDKLMTLAVLIITSAIASLMFLTYISGLQLIIISAVLILALLIILSKPGRSLIKRYILRSYSNKFIGFSDTFFSYLKHNKKILLINLSLTITKLFLTSLIIYYAFISVNTYASLWAIFLINSILIFISFIPITLNGLGAREAAAAILFKEISIKAQTTAAVFILILILRYLIAAILVFLFWEKKKVPLKAT